MRKRDEVGGGPRRAMKVKGDWGTGDLFPSLGGTTLKIKPSP